MPITPEKIARLRELLEKAKSAAAKPRASFARLEAEDEIGAAASAALPALLDAYEAEKAAREKAEAEVTELTKISRGAVESLAETERELEQAEARAERLAKEVERLSGTLRYIHAQSVSKAYADTPHFALSVIERNASAALNLEFQETVKVVLAALAEEPKT